MGLTILYGIEDFLKESISADFASKSFLMLGKQDMYVNRVQAFVIAKRLGAKLNYKLLDSTGNGMTDSYSFFKALGFEEVHAMDISAYQNADIIFDLNERDLPNELIERFDYILDGGTLEHVFDFAQALRNVSKMLKVGGKVFHYIPSAVGYINHGYYNLSPSLLQDFYISNGYQVERMNILLAKGGVLTPSGLQDWFSTEPDYRIYNFRDKDDVLAGYNGILRCVAKKINSTVEPINPKQTHWYGLVNGDLLLEMWSADLNLDEDNPAIGILGVSDLTQIILNVLQNYPKFARHKIKAILVDDIASAPKFFQGYPVASLEELLTIGIKTIFLPTLDVRIYEQFLNLKISNLKIVWLGEYAPAMQS